MKRFKIVGIATFLLYSTAAHATQYLYPIATIEQYVYCIYQSNPEIISLLVWDSEHNEMIPGLLSRYMPAGFNVLPDKLSFSFFDNGILRVKESIKRSPKSIEFYAPIYAPHIPQWIDMHTGYFSAKVLNSFGIFQFNTEASIATLLLNPKKDFLYPQKIDSTLFYIERIKRGLGYQFRVLSIPYPELDTIDMHFDEDKLIFKPILSNDQATTVIDFHNEPVAFLSMHDSSTGYLVSYPMHLDEQDDYLECSYYMLHKKEGLWIENRLFDFVIPVSLLLKSSPDSLFESILPLLPRHIGSDIYFVDASNSISLNLNLFVFHQDGTRQQLTNNQVPGVHYLGPIQIGNSLYCGGSECSDGLHFIKMIN